MKKINLYVLLSLTFISFKASANSFDILDFRFALNDPTFITWQTPLGAQNMDPSLYGTLVEGTYQGSNSTSDLINFDILGGHVHVYTSASNIGPSGVFHPGGGTEFGSNTPSGSILGGPAPTIDLVNLTADMSSWFAEWNGTDMNQGNNSDFTACSTAANYDLLSSAAVATNNGNNNYSINWNSCIPGVKSSTIGFWQLDLECTTCDVSAVTLPASVLLFGTGLLALIGMSRRNNRA